MGKFLFIDKFDDVKPPPKDHSLTNGLENEFTGKSCLPPGYKFCTDEEVVERWWEYYKQESKKKQGEM